MYDLGLDLESYTAAELQRANTEARRKLAEVLLRSQNYRNVPLLLETEIRPFESLESILFQAAKNNGMASVSPLLQALDLPRRGILNPKRHAQLGRSLQAEGDALAAAVPTAPSVILPKGSVIYGGHCLRRDQLALTTSRVCPACVRESGYGRAWWALAPLAFCDIHGTALLDQCPRCRSPISMARPAYDTCSCGANLGATLSTSCNLAHQVLAQLVAARFKREPTPVRLEEQGFPARYLGALGLSALLDLVKFGGALSPDQGTVRLRKLIGAVRLDHAAAGHARAARMLADWPNGFYLELRRARAFLPSSDTQYQVARSLDHIVQLATGSLRQPELQFVVAEIARFLQKPDEWNESRKEAARKRLKS